MGVGSQLCAQGHPEGCPRSAGWVQCPSPTLGSSAFSHLQMPTARMIAFVMALMGCVLIMYKAIWYDQFTCPDGFLLRVRQASSGPGGKGARRNSTREGPWGVSPAEA